MTNQQKISRRAAFTTAFGLTVAPVLLATAASARGGPDPWKPKRRKSLSDIPEEALARSPKLGGPRMR
ncbi:MAG: hypothetical protein AAF280_00215 [Pseudomonadota bacterium]